MKLAYNFRKFLEKWRRGKKSDLLPVDERKITNLVEKSEDHIKAAKKLNAEILDLARSTKTLFPFITPLHNYCRMKWRWYYKWHVWKYAPVAHWVALLLILVSSIYLGPDIEFARAGNGCQSNGTGGNWSASASWTACGDTTPQATDTVTILNGDTITLDTTGSVTDLTIDAGGTLTVSGSNGLSLAGSYNNNGTFTASTGTVTFTSTAAAKTLAGAMTGSNKFNNLTFNGSGGGWTASNDIDVSTVLALTTGTFNASTKTITLLGGGTPLTLGGTLNADTSTFVYASADATTVPAANYYNLSVASPNTPSTQYLWLPNPCGSECVGTVSKVSTSDGSVIGTYNVDKSPFGVAVDGSGNVWVANQNASNVTKINGLTGATIGTYTVGTSPTGIAVDGSGNIWVTNLYSSNITKLNGSSGAVIDTYTAGTNPTGIAADASGNIWVTDVTDDTVKKLNGSTGATTGTYSVGEAPQGVAVDAAGNVWVANSVSGSVTKLNGSTGAVIGTFSAGTGPADVSIDATGNAWITNYTSNNITKLNNSGALVGTYSVGTHPQGVSVDAAGNVWVPNNSDDTISKINGATGAVLGTYSVNAGPKSFGDMTGFSSQGFASGHGSTSSSYTFGAGTFNVGNNLTIGDGSAGSGALTATAATNNPVFNVTGSTIIATGATLTASSSAAFNVATNWSNSGTFTPGTGKITLSGAGGSTQVVSGSTTFYDLEATASAARTVNFVAGTTQTVTGTWTVTGASGQHITMGRTGGSGSDQWNVNPTNVSIDYVTVANSNNQAAAAINPTNFTEGDNNTKWGPALITISGTAYTDDGGGTTVADGTTVGLSINGGDKATTTTTSGAFSFTDQTVVADGTITLYLSGGTYTGNLVALINDPSTSMTGLSLYANDVVLTNQTSGAITNTLLATANNCTDCGTDIKFSDDTGAITFSAGYKVLIKSGKSYTPGNTVTAEAITVAGTFTPEGNAVTLTGTGTPFVVTGTFTSATSTVSYTGGTTGTNVAAATYYNLTVNHASTTYTAAGDITVTNVFTITAGTYNASSYILTLSGATGTPFVATGTFTCATGTVKYSGNNSGGNTAVVVATYNNLYLDNADEIYGASASFAVGGTFTINAGSFLPVAAAIISGAGTLTGSGTAQVSRTASTAGFVNQYTITNKTLTNLTVEYVAAAAQVVSALDYGNLKISNSASATATAAGNLSVSGVFTISSGGKFSGSGYIITLSGSGTPFVNSGTFTSATSTITYTGTGATNVTSTSYYKLTLNQTGTTFTAAGDITVSYILTITAGTFDAADKTITLSGATGTPFVKTGTFTASTSTVSYTGDYAIGSTYIVSTSYFNLTLNSASETYVAAGNITVSNIFTIQAGTFGAGATTLTLSGTTGTPFVKTGTFTAQTSTVEYTGNYASGNTNLAATTYYNLILNNADETYLAAGDITTSNIMTVTAGTFDASSRTITLSGSTGTPFVINGTFTPSTSTIWFTGSYTSGNTSIPATTYYNLTLYNSTETFIAAGDITVTNIFYINNGTFNGSTYTITLSGTTGTPFTSSGTFTASTSTVHYTGNYSIGNTTVRATTYYNLILDNADETYIAAGSTGVTNVFTITAGTFDGSTATITLSGTTGTPFVNNGTFTPTTSTITYTGNYASGNTNVAAATYYKLTLNNASETYIAAGDITVSNILTITAGTFDASSRTITLSGTTGTPFVKTGTFTPSTSTIVYTGNYVTSNTNVVSTTYYNLTVNNAAETYIAAGAIGVTNVFTISAGIFSGSSYIITLSGSGTPFVNSGTFTQATSTITYTGTSATNVTAATYYNLIFNQAGTTFTAAGDITASNVLTITAGNFDAADKTITLSAYGTPFVATGTFTSSTSTVAYTGGTTATNVTAASYYNLILNRASTTYTAAGDITVSNVFTITAGTFNASTRTITLSGNTGVPFVKTGTFTQSTSTIVYSGNNAAGNTDIVAATYYNLTLNNAAETFAAAGTITVSNVLTVTAGTFDASTATITLSGTTGAPFVVDGTFTASTSTISYTGIYAAGNTAVAPVTYNNLTLNNSAEIWGAASSFAVGGNFTITAGVFLPDAAAVISGAGTLLGSGTARVSRIAATPDFSSQYTITNKTLTTLTVEYVAAAAQTVSAITYGNLKISNTASAVATAAGDLTVGTVFTISSGGIFDGSSANITLSGSGTPFVKTGTFTPSTSTITYAGATSTNIAAATYNNLTLDNDGTTFTAAGDITASGVLTVNAGAFSASTRTITLSGSGTPFVLTGTFTPGTSTILYTGAEATNITATTYYKLTLNQAGTTFTAAGDTTVSSIFTITAGTFDASSRTITLSGTTGTPFVKTGTFTPSTSTITYTGNYTSGNTNVVSTSYYNLILNNASETYIAAGDITASNILTITAGTFNASSYTITLSGTTGIPFVVLGTFTPATSTFVYSGNNTTGNNIITVASYYNLTLDNAAETFVNNGAVDVNGSFSLTNGIYTPAADLSVAGNFANSGTFNAGTYTVVFDGAGASTQIISGSTTFNNLSASATAARTIQFTAGTTTTVSGTWTIAGATSQLITLTSTTTDPWTIAPATAAVSYANINYATNTAASFCATYSQSTNNGNTGFEIGAGASCVVISVPGAPTIGTATRGNTQASVTFAPPESDGGSAITGYTVTSTPGSLTGTGASSPITVTGLTNGTSYTFTVHATNEGGDSAESDPSNAVVPATIPGAPTDASATAGTGQMTIVFSAPIDNGGDAVTGYTVTSIPGSLTGTGPSSPITVEGLSANISYTFTVHATNTVGNSNESIASAAVYTLASVPTVSVAGGYDGTSNYHIDATINANGNPEGTNYWLQYSTNGTDFSDPAGMAWQTGTTYILASLSANTQYWLKVKAKNGDDTATTYSASAAAVTPPAAPTSPSSSNVCRTSALVSWVASDGADEYTVSYGTDVAATNLGTVGDLVATNHSFSALTDNTTYYFMASATSALNGTSPYSSIESFSTASCTAPIAPSDFAGAVASTSQINWSWSDTADDETVWQVENTSGVGISPELAVNSTSWNETGLSVNTAYSRLVNVLNANGSNDSNIITLYTLANAPAAPTLVANSSNSIKVTINANSNPAATRYAIYNETLGQYVKNSDGSLQAEADWQLYANWGGVNGSINYGLSAATSYIYKVKARNGNSIETAFSTTASESTSNPTIGFSSATASGSISTATVTVPVVLSEVSGLEATVAYAVSGGTAVADSDFTFTPGTATIATSAASTSFDITILNDNLVGANKTIIITLSSPTNSTLALDTFTYTIINDNPAPSGSFTLNGGASKTSSRDLTLALSYNLATEVKISGSADFSGASYVAVSSSQTYTLPDIDGTYSVYLKYKDQYGNESEVYSNSITLDRVAPSAPTSLAATAGNAAISLVWTNPTASDLTTMRIYRGLTAGFSLGQATVTFDVAAPLATYTDTTVVNNTDYYYKVVALDDISNLSTASSEVTARPDADNPTTPGRPSLAVKLEDTDGSEVSNTRVINLNWSASTDDNSGLKSYILSIGTVSGGSEVVSQQVISGNTLSYSYEFAADGTYYVRVNSVDNAGNMSANSVELSVIIDTAGPLDLADLLMADVSSRSDNLYAVILTWKAATDSTAGLKGYVVSRNNTALALGSDTVTAGINENTTAKTASYLDFVAAGSKNSYTVKAVDKAKNESPVLASKLADTEMTRVTGQSAGAAEIVLVESIIGEGELTLSDINVSSEGSATDRTQAQVTWKSSVPSTSRVAYGLSAEYGFETKVDTGLNSSHTVILSDLKASTTYHYKVLSVDKHGKEITSSDQTFTTGGKVKQRTILEIIADSISGFFSRFYNALTSIFSVSSSRALAAEINSDIKTIYVSDISTPTKPAYAVFWPANLGKMSLERTSNGGTFTKIAETDKNFYIDSDIVANTAYTYKIGSVTGSIQDELSGKSVISDIKIESGMVSKDKASVIVSYKTDKLAQSQILYGEGGVQNAKTELDKTLNQSHTVLIDNLKPDTSYSFILRAIDKSEKNTTDSSIQNFTTQVPPVDMSLFEVIIAALESALSGLGSLIK